MARKKLFLGYIIGQNGTTEFIDSLLMVTRSEHQFYVRYAKSGAGRLEDGRNIIAKLFLETDASHLLTVDTDISFSNDDINTLLKANKDIVSGLYFGWDEASLSRYPAAGNFNAEGQWEPLSMDQLVDAKPPVEVDAAGAGFMLVSRRVFETLGVDPQRGQPYANETINDRRAGEDIVFCQRAKEAGFQTWLEPRARVGHVKQVVL